MPIANGNYLNITSNGGATGNKFAMTSSGNVGLNQASPTHLLQLGTDDAAKPTSIAFRGRALPTRIPV